MMTTILIICVICLVWFLFKPNGKSRGGGFDFDFGDSDSGD